METALFITIKNSADIWHRSALFMLRCSFYPEEKYVWQTIEKYCGQIMIWWRSDKGPAATLSLYLSCWSLAMQGSYLIVLGGENTGKIMIPLYNYQSDLVITTFIDHQDWPCPVSNNILLTRQQLGSYHCWCLMLISISALLKLISATTLSFSERFMIDILVPSEILAYCNSSSFLFPLVLFWL